MTMQFPYFDVVDDKFKHRQAQRLAYAQLQQETQKDAS